MIQSIHEIAALPHVPLEKRSTLPAESGIYFVMHGAELLYIGKTNNFLHRWAEHHRLRNLKGLSDVKIHWLAISELESLLEIEAGLISIYSPPLNGYQTPTPISSHPFRRTSGGMEMPDHKAVTKDALNDAGMNQKQLADAIGATPAAVSRALNGRLIDDRSLLLKIFEHLGIVVKLERQ